VSIATKQFLKFKELIATAEPPLLGPQRRTGTATEEEIDRRLSAFFTDEKIPSHVQPVLRSAALLWHDHLDASHTISQSIETRDGSWLHGIMHRREPDYGNAKYWFRRVGQHNAFAKLAKRAGELMREHGDSLFDDGEWKPLAFIDECEQAERAKDAEVISVLREIQAAEFDVLLEHILSQTS
jgi:hypothetical protein